MNATQLDNESGVVIGVTTALTVLVILLLVLVTITTLLLMKPKVLFQKPDPPYERKFYPSLYSYTQS